MKLVLQIALPILVLLGAAALAFLMVNALTPPPRKPPEALPPLVRVLTARAADVRVDVRTQGNVEPRAVVDVAPQVQGRVVEVSTALRNGGFFAAGEVLVRIEEQDYRLAVVQQEAAVARAELRLLQEQAEAEAADAAWKKLEGGRPADPLVAREPQLAEARKALAAAKAALEQAQLDFGRTRLSLPFAGRVRGAHVEVGQLVLAGQSLAQVYPVDAVEVRLPIPDRDAEFLDLPLHFAGADGPRPGPTVILEAAFAGKRHRWTGVVVRTEGEIDRRTRQITVVARVNDPYVAGEDPSRPPLAVGAFVEATIRGRTFPGVVEIPRAALRQDGTVLALDGERRLRLRTVEVLRQDRDSVLLASGLRDGEQVCVTLLEAFTEGMRVRIAEDAAPGQGSGR